MLDIDDFKNINDTYGHDRGDEVLIYLAKTQQNFCRNNDTPLHYGGEEFAIIFEQKTSDEVWAIMSILLDHVRRHRFEFLHAPITFSAGICEHQKGYSSDELFELAAKTLYTVKTEGKNRVEREN